MVSRSTKLNSISQKSVKIYLHATTNILRTYSECASKRKKRMRLKSVRWRKITIKNWKILKQRTQMIKLIKKLSLRRKCRFFRSVWRTWRQSLILTKKSCRSITAFSDKEKKSTGRKSRSWRKVKENMKELLERLSKLQITCKWSGRLTTKNKQRHTRNSQMTSCNFKKSLKGLKKVIKIDLMKFGRWTKTK